MPRWLSARIEQWSTPIKDSFFPLFEDENDIRGEEIFFFQKTDKSRKKNPQMCKIYPRTFSNTLFITKQKNPIKILHSCQNFKKRSNFLLYSFIFCVQEM